VGIILYLPAILLFWSCVYACKTYKYLPIYLGRYLHNRSAGRRLLRMSPVLETFAHDFSVQESCAPMPESPLAGDSNNREEWKRRRRKKNSIFPRRSVASSQQIYHKVSWLSSLKKKKKWKINTFASPVLSTLSNPNLFSVV
jgi:hypothetical protein